jgi:hypothetical protein
MNHAVLTAEAPASRRRFLETSVAALGAALLPSGRRYKALAARLVAPVVARHAQRQLEADLARLKELVERGEPAPAD